jgi:GT2 family glycosyltransferase
MSSNQERILFLLINCFNDNEVVEFITTQLSRQQNITCNIIVVNNGSKNSDILNNLDSGNTNVQVITPPENLGYLNGAKFGFDFYCQSNPIPGHTILCNTDIAFEDEHFLEKLIREPNNKNVEVIGPSIISTLTFHHQNPMYKERLNMKKIKQLLFIYSYYPIYVIYQLGAYFKRLTKKLSHKDDKQTSGSVYAVHGSFLIFTKSFFDKGNTLKFPSFLYAEELFIAEQCLKNNSKIYYNSDLNIFHKEHATSRFIKNRKHVEWLKQSLNYIYHSYYK